MTKFDIKFITPLFSRGSYDNQPEIRPSSIRGQLHWWFRALGGKHREEKDIFGGIHGGAIASRIIIRVGNINGEENKLATLPHKTGGKAAPKVAFIPGTQFELHVLPRLGGLSSSLQCKFDRAFEAWLLLGSLGLRSTRGAGSFKWQPSTNSELVYPETFEQYDARCQKLLHHEPLKYALLQDVYEDSEKARKVVSDTLGGRDDRQGENDLQRLNHPLGRAFGQRKTSPLRFRIVEIDGQFRIAALWDGRNEVTGNTDNHLRGIIQLLAQKKPALGNQLQASGMV